MATENPVRAEKNSTRPSVILEKSLPISVEQIRLRAYEIFLARAGKPGDASSDWLQAERELREMALDSRESRTGARLRAGSDVGDTAVGAKPSDRKRKGTSVADAGAARPPAGTDGAAFTREIGKPKPPDRRRP